MNQCFRPENRNSRVYQHIARQLESEVRHVYTPGEYLPSESILASRFRVNRHTVRRAIDELVAAGLVRKRQGKGSIVLRQPGEYPLNGNAHYSGNLLQQGHNPGNQVLDLRLIHAPQWLTERLNIDTESKVIFIKTLRLQDDMPRTIIDHYLPDLQWWKHLKYYRSGSLHQFLRHELGLELERKNTRLSARNPTSDEAGRLAIEMSVPLLSIKTINVIKGTGQLAEYSISCTRSDLVELVVEHS